MSDWTLYSLADAIRTRRISPTEAVRECLQNIERSKLNAFVAVNAERALDAAKRLGEELDRGQVRGPLHGVPLAYKDLFFIEGMPASCGTSVPDYFVAERTATAVDRLEQAGAITIGKLNMTELAMSPFRRQCSVWRLPKPLVIQALCRRLIERLCRCHRGWACHCCAWVGHRWLDPPAGGVLRRRGPKADVRPRQQGWGHAVVVVAGQHRAFRAHGA